MDNHLNKDNMISEYISWFKDSYNFDQYDKDNIEINTPFVNSINDNIRVFATIKNNELILDDDGDTINGLEMEGIDLSKGQRNKELNYILKQFDVLQPDDRIMIKGNIKLFPEMIQRMISAAIRIDSLRTLKKEVVTTTFNDDVYDFFRNNDFNGEENKTIVGKSGNEVRFDYAMMNKNVDSLIFLRDKINLDTTEKLLFRYRDVTNSLDKSSKLSIIFNDSNSNITNSVDNLAKTYGTDIIPFSKKEKIRELKLG